jgi:hypothetical protein
MRRSLVKHAESTERENGLNSPLISDHSFNYPHPFQVPHKNDQSKIKPGKSIVTGKFTPNSLT